jgi:HAMP domain-containing protein/HPt (histidine-containing phosphotransfer) domain-containing protein
MKRWGPGRLFAKLYGGFLAVALTGLVFAEVLVDRRVQTMERTQVEERLSYIATMLGQMSAEALFGPVDASDASLSGDISDVARAVHTELFLLTSAGRVVIDSDDAGRPSSPEQAAARDDGDQPEIVAARSGGVGIAVRGAGAERKIYVARSIVRHGQLLGFARAAFPMDAVEASIVAVRLRFAIGAAAAVVLALTLGLFISFRIMRPVKALAEGVRRIGAGDYEQHIETGSKDELADLARAFNDMARDLRAAMQQLGRRNRDLRLVLDNVDQGFVTADLGGQLSSERSAILDRWFEKPAEVTQVWEYLGSNDPCFADWFRLGWEAVADDVLPLEVALDQLPTRLERGTRTFELGYSPIQVDGRLTAVLLVVTDVSGEIELERAARDQLEIIAIFKAMTTDRAGFNDFLTEVDSLVRAISGAEASDDDRERMLHTMKGICASMGISTVASLCHNLETRLIEGGDEAFAAGLPELEASWKRVWSHAEELGARDRAPRIEVQETELLALAASIRKGIPRDRLLSLLETWRLEPTELRLRRFAGQTYALGHRLGKELDVNVASHGVRLDRETWRGFWAAFTHAVRNAVDHGVEPADERRASGKTARARIDLVTRLEQEGLVVEIRDDGRGIQWDALQERARAKGIPAATQDDLVRCLFYQGLSTRSDVTEESGRGVGLAALKRACEELGGTIHLEGVTGEGTCLRCRFSAEAVGRTIPSSLRPAGWPETPTTSLSPSIAEPHASSHPPSSTYS